MSRSAQTGREKSRAVGRLRATRTRLRLLPKRRAVTKPKAVDTALAGTITVGMGSTSTSSTSPDKLRGLRLACQRGTQLSLATTVRTEWSGISDNMVRVSRMEATPSLATMVALMPTMDRPTVGRRHTRRRLRSDSDFRRMTSVRWAQSIHLIRSAV